MLFLGTFVAMELGLQCNGMAQFVPSDFRQPFPVLAADVLLASRRGKDTLLHPQIALEAAALLDLKPTFFMYEKGIL